MNFHAIRAIYVFEMARTFRTILQSIVTPVISTSLYFVVFGAAIGSRITDIDGTDNIPSPGKSLIVHINAARSVNSELV